MWKIKENLLLDIIESSKKYYPEEFLCFLGGNKEKKEITEIVFIPIHTSKNAASINEANIPFDDTIVGTIHAHPNGNNNPSKEDKIFFKRYNINAIISYPYSLNNIDFYDENGEKTKLIIQD